MHPYIRTFLWSIGGLFVAYLFLVYVFAPLICANHQWMCIMDKSSACKVPHTTPPPRTPPVGHQPYVHVHLNRPSAYVVDRSGSCPPGQRIVLNARCVQMGPGHTRCFNGCR